MIWAKFVSGYNMSISMLFGKSPLLTVVCGKCEYTFDCRTPLMNYPTTVCPNCGTVNKLNIIID